MAASVFFFLGRIFGSICTLLFGELVSKTMGVVLIVLNDYSLIVGFFSGNYAESTGTEKKLLS